MQIFSALYRSTTFSLLLVQCGLDWKSVRAAPRTSAPRRGDWWVGIPSLPGMRRHRFNERGMMCYLSSRAHKQDNISRSRPALHILNIAATGLHTYICILGFINDIHCCSLGPISCANHCALWLVPGCSWAGCCEICQFLCVITRHA